MTSSTVDSTDTPSPSPLSLPADPAAYGSAASSAPSPASSQVAAVFVDLHRLDAAEALCQGPLWLVQARLRDSLNRVWPTRYTAKMPPAYGTTLPYGRLELPCDAVLLDNQKVLTVFLPGDLAGSLEQLLERTPGIRVHSDLGLKTHQAYLSLEIAAAAPAAPKRHPTPPTPAPAVWLKLEPVLAVLGANRLETGADLLPILLVAGEEAVLATFLPDAAWMSRAARAVEAAAQPPKALAPEELERAAEKARRYSEQPWLFMRFELYNRGQRLAVNLAPLEEVDLSLL